MKFNYLIMLVGILMFVALFYFFYAQAKSINSRLDLAVNTVENFMVSKNNDSILKADSLMQQIVRMQAEQIRYSDMVNRETDRLIFFVTILFALFGFVGYGVFRYEMISIHDKINKNNIIQDGKYESHLNKFIELEKIAYLGLGSVCSIISDYNNSTDLFKSLNFSIGAALQFKRAFLLKQEKVLSERTINNLKNAISYADSIIDKKIQYQGDEFDLNEIIKLKNALDEISQMDNDKVKSICAEIRFKFMEVEKLIPKVS